MVVPLVLMVLKKLIGERGIDRVAAVVEHREARLHRERLRRGDDVSGEHRGARPRVGQLPGEGNGHLTDCMPGMRRCGST